MPSLASTKKGRSITSRWDGTFLQKLTDSVKANLARLQDKGHRDHAQDCAPSHPVPKQRILTVFSSQIIALGVLAMPTVLSATGGVPGALIIVVIGTRYQSSLTLSC